MGNNVLYVEDNPDNMMLVQRALESRGYRLLKAVNGLSGVEVAEREDVDLILLDINLPDIDGYEVARRIRQQREFDDVILIALTGWGQEDDRRRSHSAGFDHHLTKPADIGILEALLASLHSRQ